MNVHERPHFSGNNAGSRPSGNARGCLGIAAIVSAVLASIWVVLGLVFVCIGAGLYLYTVQFAKTAHSAEGTVIELERSTSKNSGATWCPVIEFSDHRGDMYRVQLSTCRNPPGYWRGEEVEVLYAGDNPKNARINDNSMYWFGWIFAGIGGIFAVLGGLWLVFLFFARKYLRKKAHSVATVS